MMRPFPFTFGDLVVTNLATRADHTALIFGDDRRTYATMADEAAGVAAWLRAKGVNRGERVIVHLPKGIEEVVATIGCSFADTVFVNANWQLKARQLEHIRSDCDARVLITEAARARRLAAAGILDRFSTVLLTGGAGQFANATRWQDLPDAQWRDVVALCRNVGADLAALLYTSGSTGNPKGVMVTHENLVQGAMSVATYLGNTADDRVLGLLPMSFDYGLSQFTTMFLVGGSVVIQPVPFPAEIAATVQREAVTGIAAVPTIWIQLVQYIHEADGSERMGSVRYVTNSGGKIPDATLRAMPAAFPEAEIFLMYGLTEAFRSTFLPPKLYASRMGSMGRAIPNVEIYVVNERGICAAGETGELLHRGALISQGYWGAPELTAERIRVNEHLRPLIGEEKVVHSGDLVTIDEDGFLWFVGRKDHLIKSSGIRISPTEVEEVAHESGLVQDAIAFGVPDEALGEVVHLAVSSRSTDDVVALLARQYRDKMPNHMVPARIWLWPELMPRTATGKLDRPAVVSALREQLAAQDNSAISNSPVGETA